MAKKLVQIGKGYPLDHIVRVSQRPLQANPPLPRIPYVNDPGDYVTLEETDWFNVAVTRDTILPSDEPTPDGQLIFLADKTYNCIQISMDCRNAASNYVVPDMLALCIPETRVSDVAGTPLTYQNQPRIVRHANTDAVAKDRWSQIRAYTLARFSPPKTYLAPILGSSANSTSRYSGLVFEALGVKPFSIAFMQQWNEYRLGSRDVPSTATDGNSPIYRFTCWYDARLTSLSLRLGGSE